MSGELLTEVQKGDIVYKIHDEDAARTNHSHNYAETSNGGPANSALTADTATTAGSATTATTATKATQDEKGNNINNTYLTQHHTSIEYSCSLGTINSGGKVAGTFYIKQPTGFSDAHSPRTAGIQGWSPGNNTSSIVITRCEFHPVATGSTATTIEKQAVALGAKDKFYIAAKNVGSSKVNDVKVHIWMNWYNKAIDSSFNDNNEIIKIEMTDENPD